MSKKKIYYTLSVFLLFSITISVLNARSHPPSNVHMEYNLDTEQLDIIYTHGVSDPEVHYLYLIEVWVNVTQVWEDHHHHTHFDSQDNYALAIPPPPSVVPNYTFYFTEQPTDITPITVSHTLARYVLDIPYSL